MRRAVPLLAAVLLLAGCSESTIGSPTAGSPTGATTESSGKPTSTSKEPAKRPKTINLKDVDPCALLTDAQRGEFGLDRPPQKGTSTTHGTPTCSFSREDRTHIVGLGTNTANGIEFFTDGRFDVEAQKLQVGGFPAVVGSDPKDPSVCFLGIDVSDGQMLQADVVVPNGGWDQAKTCGLTQQVAAAALATLVAR